ncbi:A disintegrin and metalloproteinase with thrombospondin motifs 19-like [Ruditapes philippinarum]|uniref:A disintegrin and metalloproteinase with thrombospondin motifs 19-like n=1 Tax=Ruditapes philippinarum TaxID=129788 RepID=UPI00295C07D0|nr:A disintegrin and metalloproteinase with thrombospondin motifs 19-like [Ruditapes philippinarum]
MKDNKLLYKNKKIFNRFYLTIILFTTFTDNGYCQPEAYKGHDGVGVIFTNATDQLLQCRYPDYFNIRMALSGQDEMIVYLRKQPPALNRFPPAYLLSRLPRKDDYTETRKQNIIRYMSTSPDSHFIVQCDHDKKSTDFHLSGVILYKGSEFVIQTIKQSSKFGIILTRWHQIKDIPRTHDYIISEKSRFPAVQETVHLSRDRREVMRVHDVLTFTIDVLVVVDFNIYTKWMSNAAGRNLKEKSLHAKSEIQKYYLHVINGIDLRYQSIGFEDFQIRISVSGIVIIDKHTSVNGSTFNPPPTSNTSLNGTLEMDADTALKMFRTWVNETKGLPDHSHAILFTGYDLYSLKTSEDKQKQSHTSGLAFIGTLCEPGDSVSIVEEQGGFQSIGTAAHELGHSLGALHDGENNTCHSVDRYIMAASGFGPVPNNKKYHPWIFSRCSVDYFKEFITSLLLEGSTCLTSKRPNVTDILEVVNSTLDLPGQDYTPDDQCRMIWGPTSYLCRGSEFGNASTICTAMYCRDPSTESDCVLHVAARGTTCGNKQWCMDGHCVYSPKAPDKQGPCLLGDQPGAAFNSMTCEQLIAKSSSYCYQEKVRSRCCNSCWSKFTYKKGCEYGNRIQGCRSWHCSHFFESRDIQTECCGTCNIGEVITSTDTQAQLPIEEHRPVTTAKWNSHTCTDSSAFSCPDYIRSRGSFVCYSNVTSAKCCQSCKMIKSQTEGCDYGDKVPSLCAEMKTVTELDCDVYGTLCCKSCIRKIKTLSSCSNCLYSLNVLFINFILILVFKDP